MSDLNATVLFETGDKRKVRLTMINGGFVLDSAVPPELREVVVRRLVSWCSRLARETEPRPGKPA